jgi:hypothetical protein
MINNRDKLKKTATDLNIEFPKNIKNERLLKLIEEKQGNELIVEEINETKDIKVIANNKYNDNELITAVRKKDINAIKKILKEDNKQAQFKNDEGLTAYEIAWNQECSYEILYLFKNNT